MGSRSVFAAVVLPLAVPGTFTYLVPNAFVDVVQAGVRVLVSFGNGKKLYSGIIYSVSETYNGEVAISALSSIIQVLDTVPVLPPNSFKLLEWISDYYCCTLGEAVRAALPTRLTIESLTYVKRGNVVPPEITPTQQYDTLFLQPNSHNSLLVKCYQLLIESEPRNSVEFSEVLGVRNYKKYLREWAAAGYIQLAEEPVFKYKQKIKRTLSLSPPYTNLEVLEKVINTAKAPKQGMVLKFLYQASFQKETPTIGRVCEQVGCSESVVKILIKNGLIEERTEVVSRLSEIEAQEPRYQLQPKQAQVVQQIYESWAKNPAKPVLLMGVTGSGKTFVYMELIREQLKQGNQCLYILPEISLTEHIVYRLKQNFGNQLVVYHSRMRPDEKVEIWNSVRAGEFPIIVGVRSAIFLPFHKLGLVIVDEEHDGSLKQHDDAPRYYGKDAALMLAKIWHAKALLGSATPSLESYYAATQESKFTFLELPDKAISRQPVTWEIIDMRHQFLHKLSTGIFSSILMEAVDKTLKKGEQAILFLNRRGYAPVLQCDACGYTPVCPYCDVALTAHLHSYQLSCHYCGYTNPYSKRCPKCQQNKLQDIGYGTEKVEEHLQELFPQAKIARMDSDTVSSTLDLSALIKSFANKEIDILVGTQMVTKGLDFESVTIASILDADRLLFQSDFRALEHTFALITQLAGRTGRHQKSGTIFIQTKAPEHAVFQLLSQPIENFFEAELQTRKKYLYPPYVRLIRIELKHKSIQFLSQSVEALQVLLKSTFGEYLFGPATPPIPRLQAYYRQYFLLKIPHNISPGIPKKHLLQIISAFSQQKDCPKIIIDVDPR